MVRAFPSHQCGPSLNPRPSIMTGSSLLSVLILAQGFFSGFFCFPILAQKPTLFKYFQFDLETLDPYPGHGGATDNLHYIIFVSFKITFKPKET